MTTASPADRPLHSPAKLPRSIRLLCGIALVLQFLNLITTSPQPNPFDGQGYMAWGQALLADGHWDPTHVLAGDNYFPVREINGHHAALNKYPIGWSLLTLPTAAAGQFLTFLTNRAGFTHYPLDGHSPLLTRGAWIGAYLWIDLGIISAYRATSKVTSPLIAQWAICLVWLGTSAFAYTWRWPYMSHGLSLAILSIVFYFALGLCEQIHARHISLFIFGFLAGLALCVRLLNIIYLAPIALLVVMAKPPTPLRRTVQAAAFALLGTIPPLALQTWVWKSVYGDWYFNGYAASGERFVLNGIHLLRFLFSSYDGLFFFHPVTILCLSGLAVALVQPTLAATRRVFAALLLIAIGLTILLYGSWSDWDKGDGFGARWACDPFIFWTLGLAFLLTRVRLSKPLLACALLMAIYSAILVGGQTVNLFSRLGNLRIHIPGRGWIALP